MLRNAPSLFSPNRARLPAYFLQLGSARTFRNTKQRVPYTPLVKAAHFASNAPVGYSGLTSEEWSRRLPEFKFPNNSLYFALTPEHGRVDFPKYKATLEDQGILSIKLGFPDPLSTFFAELTQSIGRPRTNSAKEGVLWCVLC
jgi:hypothetical protein